MDEASKELQYREPQPRSYSSKKAEQHKSRKVYRHNIDESRWVVNASGSKVRTITETSREVLSSESPIFVDNPVGTTKHTKTTYQKCLLEKLAATTGMLLSGMRKSPGGKGCKYRSR